MICQLEDIFQKVDCSQDDSFRTCSRTKDKGDSRRRNGANNTQVSFINLSDTLIVLVFSSISAQFI